MNVFCNHIYCNLRVILAIQIIKSILQSCHLFRKKAPQKAVFFMVSYIWLVIIGSVAQNGVVVAEVKIDTIQQANILNQQIANNATGQYLAKLSKLQGVTHYSSMANPIPIATFTQASAMVKGLDGVIVSDQTEHKMYLFTIDGELGIEAGGMGEGTESLHTPTDLVSKNGLKIYVADKENGRVKILDHELHYLSSLDISRAGTDYSGGLDRFGVATSWKPEKLCLLDSGYLQVWDALGRGIHRFNSKGDYLGFSTLYEVIGPITDMQCRADYIELYSAQSKKIARISGNGLWLGSYDITRDHVYLSNISSTNYADKWDELEQNYGLWVNSITEGTRLWILFERALFSFDIVQQEDN
tara:strand:+ start:10834 stop:11904 length:1071 start_codon:yes stop_codon:yes gene_type:complete